MTSRQRKEFYRNDRKALLTKIVSVRDQAVGERSGTVLHALDVELQYNRDRLAHLRRSR